MSDFLKKKRKKEIKRLAFVVALLLVRGLFFTIPTLFSPDPSSPNSLALLSRHDGGTGVVKKKTFLTLRLQ